jgi:phytanoyl-CoA hydroxylase
MKLEITNAQIQQFQTQGFVVLHDFLSPTELEEWRSVVGEAVRDRLENNNGINNQAPGSDEYYKAIFTQALRLMDTHPEIERLVCDPRLGEVAAKLMSAQGVRLWHDQALIKPPYGNQTAWHRDTPYWAMHTPKTANFWFALDDATLENGCLWYLPGTQQSTDYSLVPIKSSMQDIFKAYPEYKSIEAVSAPMKAGGVVIHNGMIIHGASSNMTPRPRRAMTSVYFEDGTPYRGEPDTLPEAYYKDLQAGQPLNDDRYVPLVWSAKTDSSQVQVS